MSRVIAQRELRNNNAEIMNAVASGETFIVTRHGVPVAELRPLAIERRTFLSKADIERIFAHSPRIDRDAFRRDSDAVVDQQIQP